MSRTDAQVDFDWDLGAIGGLSVADFAGVRWCGYLGVNDVPSARTTPDGHKYVIWLDLGAESDGARLWINGTLIIDAWDRGHERLPSASILLRPGTLNSLTLEYRHTRGQAAIRLLWSSPWTILQPIPSKNLFHTVSLERSVDLRVNHGRPFTASLYPTNLLSCMMKFRTECSPPFVIENETGWTARSSCLGPRCIGR